MYTETVYKGVAIVYYECMATNLQYQRDFRNRMQDLFYANNPHLVDPRKPVEGKTVDPREALATQLPGLKSSIRELRPRPAK